MKTKTFLLILLAFCSLTYSQNYWQQSVNYKMEVDIDVKTFKYSGRQDLLYTNNSPDSLKKFLPPLFQRFSTRERNVCKGKNWKRQKYSL